MANVHKLREIVADARYGFDNASKYDGVQNWIDRYADLLWELEDLIEPPDPPQVHIPGLDQTEWTPSARR